MCYYNPLHRSRRFINQYFRLTDQNAKLFTRNHDMCFAEKSARMRPGCSRWSAAWSKHWRQCVWLTCQTRTRDTLASRCSKRAARKPPRCGTGDRAKNTHCELSSFGPALFEIWWPDIYLGGPYPDVRVEVPRDLNTDVSVFDWHARLGLVTRWRLAVAKGLRENRRDVGRATARKIHTVNCHRSGQHYLKSGGPTYIWVARTGQWQIKCTGPNWSGGLTSAPGQRASAYVEGCVAVRCSAFIKCFLYMCTCSFVVHFLCFRISLYQFIQTITTPAMLYIIIGTYRTQHH